ATMSGGPSPPGHYAQILEAIAKLAKLPIWLLVAVTVVLSIFLFTPVFSALVSPTTCMWIAVADVASVVLMVARIWDEVWRRVVPLRPKQQKLFHLTALEQYSAW